jgi:membrane-associated protease RseP (regulator of RpoE activity)
MMGSFLLTLLIVSVIVVVHEFGHFLLAKKNGIEVVEFSVGFGPTLFAFERGGTRYAFKAILFGGEGLDPASYSINDILGIVIANENATFNEGFVTLAKSLWNYGIEAYNRFSGETSSLTKQTLSSPADAEIIASATDGVIADAKLVGRALVLREAVGLRVYLNLQNGVKAEDLTFTLNGTELGKELLYIREESGNGYNASVTVYVSAAAMNRTLNLSVAMDGEAVGSYTDSIASVCQQYREAGGKDAALCTAILRYIQAVPGMND